MAQERDDKTKIAYLISRSFTSAKKEINDCGMNINVARTEDESGIARDTLLPSLTVRHGRRDGQKALPASLHASNAHIPA